MSENGFGYYNGEETFYDEDPQQVPPQQASPDDSKSPKWFREYMDKSSKEIKELRMKLNQKEVAEQFQAKGYDPGAAALYQGPAEKVDEWLSANGNYLAKRGSAEPEPEVPEVPKTPPTSSLSAEDQAKLQQFNAAGTSAASPLGSEAELSAALSAAKTIQEFEQVARANGWDYSTDGLFG